MEGRKDAARRREISAVSVVETLMRWIGVDPPQVQSRPASEIIEDVEKHEQEEREQIRAAMEEVRNDPDRPLTTDEFLKSLRMKRNGEYGDERES